MLYYDTIEGIYESIKTLAGLNDVIDKRHESYYVRRERLKEFCVLGKYYLDTCGNVGMLDTETLISIIEPSNIPDVLTKEQLLNIIKKYDVKRGAWTHEDTQEKDFNWYDRSKPFPTSFSIHYKNTIPPERIICPFCKKGWDISNTDNVDVKTEQFRVIPNKDFSLPGASIAQAREFYKGITHAVYQLRNTIRNDKYIVPSLGIEGEKVNEKGWIDVDDNYIIQEGDDMAAAVFTFYHKECIQVKTSIECAEHLENKGKDYKMPNLAGLIECNEYIKLELELAGIDVYQTSELPTGEVKSSYKGYLHCAFERFSFERAWSYWIVTGSVPLELAKKMYNTEEGKRSVRVQGDCGCPAPEKWERDGYVSLYHIDTVEGLKLFADTVKTMHVEGVKLLGKYENTITKIQPGR